MDQREAAVMAKCVPVPSGALPLQDFRPLSSEVVFCLAVTGQCEKGRNALRTVGGMTMKTLKLAAWIIVGVLLVGWRLWVVAGNLDPQIYDEILQDTPNLMLWVKVSTVVMGVGFLIAARFHQDSQGALGKEV